MVINYNFNIALDIIKILYENDNKDNLNSKLLEIKIGVSASIIRNIFSRFREIDLIVTNNRGVYLNKDIKDVKAIDLYKAIKHKIDNNYQNNYLCLCLSKISIYDLIYNKY